MRTLFQVYIFLFIFSQNFNRTVLAIAYERVTKVIAGSVVGPNGLGTSSFTTTLDGLWGDSSNSMFYADVDTCLIRQVSIITGYVYNVVGTGLCGYNGDQMAASNTQLQSPKKIFTDTIGTLYFTEKWFVRRVSTSNVVKIVAGVYLSTGAIDNVPATSSGLNNPTSVWVDTYLNIYISDRYNHRIRKVTISGIITTIAGNGNNGNTGNGGPATSATISSPVDIQGDNQGNLYILQTEGIRQVTLVDGKIYLYRNTPMVSGFWVASDAVYIADTVHSEIVKMSPNATIPGQTIAGTGATGVVDPNEHRPLFVNLGWPTDVWIDSASNMYIADSNNRVIWRIVPGGGNYMSVYVGGSTFGGDGAAATTAIFNEPKGIWGDTTGNIFIMDSGNKRVRAVSPTGLIISSFSTGGLINGWGLYGDTNAFIYVTDYGKRVILRYNNGGTVSRFAGQDNDPGCDPGANVASSSKLNYPTGIWIDSLSNVFVADSNCHVIRKIRSNDTVLTTYAGIRYTSGSAVDSSPATSAALYYPSVIWGNSIGELFIGDNNNIIQKITNSGIIYTLSGYGGSYGVQSIQPLAISGDLQGNLFIIETNNYLMSSFPSTAPGLVTAVAGVSSFIADFGSQNVGEAKSLRIGRSFFLFVDSLSNIFYSDIVTGTVRKIYQINAPTGQPSSQPSRAPSRQPTSQPSSRPTGQPTRQPSGQPSCQPTRQPSGQPSSSPSFIIAKLASLSDGLVAYYPFSGNTFDKTDNRNHGNPNGIYYVTDRHGRATEAAKFDGASPQSFIELPGTMFNFFSDMSVSMWIKPAAAQPSYAAILDKSHIDFNNGNRVAGWSVLQDGTTNNDYYYEFFTPAVGNVAMSVTILSVDVWSHLVISKSDATRKIYVNGAPVRTSVGVYKEIISNGVLPLMLGALNTGLTKPASAISNFWVGVMDDLYIFNRTITDAEVQSLFRDSPYDTPTGRPSSQPSRQPSAQPSTQPSTRPTNQPSRQPTSKPSGQPSRAPSSQPSRQPSSQPSSQPSRQSTSKPSGQPSSDPTCQPSRCPTGQPTTHPSRAPSSQPSRQPSSQPSGQPSRQPTSKPSGQPSSDPTCQPSRCPTAQPTAQPSRQPSSQPSKSPSNQPTADPTRQPSAQPTARPSQQPSSQPSRQPTGQPTADPTRQPSSQPTSRPSRQPSAQPSRQPSGQPSSQPSVLIDDMTSLQDGLVAYYPFSGNTLDKSGNRLHANPHSVSIGVDRFGRASEAANFDGGSSYLEIPGRKFNFVYNMSVSMWIRPSSFQFAGAAILDKSHYLGSNSAEIAAWSFRQDGSLGNQYSYVFVSEAEGRINMPGVQLLADTWSHVVVVKGGRTRRMYVNGALAVTSNYILSDIVSNSAMPLLVGALNSFNTNPATGVNRFWGGKMDDLLIFNRTLTEAEILRLYDFNSPTSQPSSQPSRDPTTQPTRQPTSRPSNQPSTRPTGQPTSQPSRQPSGQPSVQPSSRPSGQPTSRPSSQPTRQPSGQPSNQPIAGPTSQPSTQPSGRPSTQPSRQPSSRPSSQPTSLPTDQPTSRPSGQPSVQPSSQPSSRPSGQPTLQPTSQPTRQPSGQPTCQPTARPTNQPTSQPSRKPSSHPSNQPTTQPSRQPTTQPTSQPSVIIAGLSSLHEGLVAYFPFSGNAKDMSGRRNHGVEYGIYYGNDRFHRNGEAVYFDGASAYVEVPGAQFNFPVNMSISLWIKPSTTQASYACLLDKTRFLSGAAVTGWSFLQEGGADNNYYYGFSSLLGGGDVDSSSAEILPLVWSHLVVVKSDVILSIYVNGVRVVHDDGVYKDILSNGDRPLVIGALNSGYTNPATVLVNHWSGLMDDLMIFNRTLKETEIISLYQDSPYDRPTSFPSSQPSRRPSSQPSTQPSRQPTTQPTSQPSVVIAGLSSLHEGLMAFLPFSGSAKDVSGRRNHGVEYGTSYGIDRFNRNGEAVGFDGASAYIEVPGEQFNFPVNMSISLWIKPSLTQNSYGCLLDKTRFDGAPTTGWSFLQDAGATNNYTFDYSSDLWSGLDVRSAPVVVTPGVWSHLVAVKSDAVRNIYVNGARVVHDVGIYKEVLSNGDKPLVIGAMNAGYTNPATVLVFHWEGLMDDLMIFNRTLTESEIISLYQDSPYDRPTSFPSSQPSRRPTSQPSTQPSRHPTTQPTSQPSVVIAGLSSLHEGLVAYYPFSGSAKDLSGRRNHGVEYGTSYGIDRFNRNGEAVNFDGSNGYIEVPGAQFNFQSNMSISLWIKAATLQKQFACLLDKTHFDTGSVSGWALLQDGASTNEYLYEFSPVQASLTGYVDSSAVIIDPEVWTHLVLVKSDAVRNIYVNGVNVVHDGSIYKEIISNGGLPLIIGAINSGFSDPASNLVDLWTGLMDDLMIFDRPLTEEEITTLYNDSPYERPTSFPSSQPSCEPLSQPSQQPISSPSSQPSRQPTTKPSTQPSSHPTVVPSLQSTRQPTNQPTGRPTTKPSTQPSSSPTDIPSKQPSSQPTRQPVSHPTCQPSTQPSTSPTGQPSEQPTSLPTTQPTIIPSKQPSSCPSSQPSNTPSSQPVTFPSSSPSVSPSLLPSSLPSSQPSLRPSSPPTGYPSALPSAQPSVIPSNRPTRQPSARPSSFPTRQPTQTPTNIPTSQPSDHPMSFPSRRPSIQPTSQPTGSPIAHPSELPTSKPSTRPSTQPISCPSSQPSRCPTAQSSKTPSSQPSEHPSALPSQQPFSRPTAGPSSQPVGWPTRSPSSQPSSRPSIHLIRSIPPSSRVPVTSKPSLSLYPTRTTAPNTLPFSVSPANARRFQGNLFLFGTASRPSPQGSDLTIVKDIRMGENPASTEQQSFVLFGQRKKFLRNILLNETRNSGVVVELTSPSPLVLSHDSMSRSSAVVDDLNHDGFPDLIVGYPLSSTCLVYFSNNLQDQLLGGFTGLTVSLTIYGPTQSEFGWAVAALGDINGDSYNDMIVSAKALNTLYLLFGQSNYNEFEGNEFVLFVENMSRTEGIKITGSGSCFNTGLSVGRAVDFNGDGFKDIVFSALSRTTSQGIVFILFNSENHWDNDISVDDLNNNPKNQTTDVFKIIFPAFSFAGLSLASIGDTNSDGFEDIAIGSLPYKGGYQSQRTYLIYGRRGRERSGRRLAGEEGSGDGRNETMELSEMREGIDGITIIGGGFLVAGPGDLNGDGIADLLIMSYPHWQGESNSYLIHYPDDRMSSPPSPFPSSSPSSLPSSAPSSSPTLFLTTETPSNLPTISTPSPTIDHSQPFLSFSPTTTIKPTRSPTQTLPPKSIRPTRLPTVRPTRYPSTSVPTSEAPSLKTVTALPTTVQPSLVPSFRPSKIPISSEPTFPANDDSSIGYETIYCIDNTVTCRGSTTMNTQFIVQTAGKIHIHCGEQFRCIYLISPLENSEILIDDFDLQKDKIDLSLFPWIQEPGQISMSTNPLTILLSPTQKVIFDSFTNFAFTESNFLFQPPEKKKKTNLLNEKIIQILLLSLLGLFFSVCLFFGGGTASDSLEDIIKKEADKRKKVHSRASSEQHQYEEHREESDSPEFEEESLLSVIEEGPNPSFSLSSSAAASYILDNNNPHDRDPEIWRSRKAAESEENRKIMRLNNLSSSSSSSSLSDDGLAILGIGTLDSDSDNDNNSSFNDNDTHWEISDLGTEEMDEEEGKEEIEYYDEDDEDDSVYGEGIRFRGQLLSFATEWGARSRSRSRARSHARSFGSSSVGDGPLLSSSSGSSHSPLHSSSEEKLSLSSSSSSASVNGSDKSSDEEMSLSHRQDTTSNYSYFSDQDL
jgi:hypothetical protein